MQSRSSQLVLLICAAGLFGLVGCRSGFRSLNATAGDRAPFLDDDPGKLVDDDRLGQAADSALANLEASPDTARSAVSEMKVDASDFADQFAAEVDEGFDRVKNSVQHAEAEAAAVIDGSMFADMPDASGDATGRSDSDNRIERVEYQAQLPPDPTPPTVKPRVNNSGLGSVSPWGRANPGKSGLDVELTFEDNDDTDIRIDAKPAEVTDFPIDLDNFPVDELSPVPPVPPTTSTVAPKDPAPRDERRWGRPFSIFNSEAPASGTAEALSPEPAVVPEPNPTVKREKKSIRDRFSQLGARFGLADNEQLEPAPSVVATDQSTRPKECIEDLISRAEARLAKASPAGMTEAERDLYLRDQVNLRLFYLANNQHERALDAIPGIPPAEQEFWRQMFWSLAQYRNSEAVPDRTERITQTVSQLRTALQRLQETARLQLRNVSFCRRITGYGNYERFEEDVFNPGDPVLVYAEIENFRSEPTTSGQYRTLLRSNLQILSEGGRGKTVDSVTLQPVEDICRTARRDYFNSYEFTIPNDIKPGRYVLQISVDDQLSGKSAKQSVLFSVP